MLIFEPLMFRPAATPGPLVTAGGCATFSGLTARERARSGSRSRAHHVLASSQGALEPAHLIVKRDVRHHLPPVHLPSLGLDG
jgi:hypothetical protein